MKHRRPSIPPVELQRQSTGDLLFDVLTLTLSAAIAVISFVFFAHPFISAILERIYPNG